MTWAHRIVAGCFIAASIVAGALLAPGCASARRDEPLVGPVELPTPELRMGQQVFMRHCYQCHPGGRAGVGPALNNKPLPAALIKTQVRQGLGEMPAFGTDILRETEVDAVADYMIALRQNKPDKRK
ncbi:MAG TPA: cytochrome c [Tepidisphaeraceae bacterium]|nr:cytochrome c [Tepidisphaeraceae bacterium]